MALEGLERGAVAAARLGADALDGGEAAVVDAADGDPRRGPRGRVALVELRVAGGQRLVVRQEGAQRDVVGRGDRGGLRGVGQVGLRRDARAGQDPDTRRDRHAGPDVGQPADDRARLDRGAVDHRIVADLRRLGRGVERPDRARARHRRAVADQRGVADQHARRRVLRARGVADDRGVVQDARPVADLDQPGGRVELRVGADEVLVPDDDVLAVDDPGGGIDEAGKRVAGAVGGDRGVRAGRLDPDRVDERVSQIDRRDRAEHEPPFQAIGLGPVIPAPPSADSIHGITGR